MFQQYASFSTTLLMAFKDVLCLSIIIAMERVSPMEANIEMNTISKAIPLCPCLVALLLNMQILACLFHLDLEQLPHKEASHIDLS
jgi:hypothetical protein